MVKRGRGGVLIVGSEAALGGQGRLSMFTANKGYAINVGESPWQEWQSHGVDVLNAIINAIIGATDTPHLRHALTSLCQRTGAARQLLILLDAKGTCPTLRASPGCCRWLRRKPTSYNEPVPSVCHRK
jgi:hypothetical protein